MPHIEIISASVREERNSHRVALFFQNYLEQNELASSNILDLKEYNFPLFEERLNRQKWPLTKALGFSEKIKDADGVIIVTPEYNGGYPASLKNVIDLLYAQWRRKPIAIATVSDGVFGGTQVITSLQFSLWKIRAWTVPAMFPVPSVLDEFDEDGNAKDSEETNKRAKVFINELLWCIEANKRMKN
ncbi:MAG TPA: FMN reductase [Bacteroidales bacterium]|jgi:NAD(P)H-dependent FMN reductase|nr:FMN reductase [Bacteroidales bacterium]